MSQSDLEDFLNQRKIACSNLDKKEIYRLRQEWRSVFSICLHQQTGKWRIGDIDWHTFSYKHAVHVGGAKAQDSYKSISGMSEIVIIDENAGIGFRCTVGELPDLTEIGRDLYVFPISLDWTMVFTHEQDFGPYFSRKEWQSNYEKKKL